MTTPPRTTAAKLAFTALRLLDNASLSTAVGRPIGRLKAWAAGEPSGLDEQTAMVLAVLALATPESPATRLALTLRDQIRATLAFHHGETATHPSSPPGWPR